MEKMVVSGVMSAAIWIGSGALVLMVVTIIWGFAKIVEYSKRMAVSFEQIQRQLGLINESIEDMRRDMQSRNV